jgi:hypothetical protein
MRRDKLLLIKCFNVSELGLPIHLLLEYLKKRITDAFGLAF